MSIRNFLNDDKRYNSYSSYDYGDYRAKTYKNGREQPKRSHALAVQCLLAVLCFALTAYAWQSESTLGGAAQQGVNWIYDAQNTLIPEGGSVVLDENTPQEAEQEMLLTLPVSGILQREFTGPVQATAAEAAPPSEGQPQDLPAPLPQDRAGQGIEIGTQLGVAVRSGGAGLVEKVEQQADGSWSVSVRHNAKLATCYGGLVAAEVKAKTRISQGDVLGQTGEQPIFFAVYLDNQPVDPLAYIRAQQDKSAGQDV